MVTFDKLEENNHDCFFSPLGSFGVQVLSETFVAVIHKDKVPQKQPLCVEVQGHKLALCRVKDGIYAIENQCSHARASFDGGRLKAYRLSCPLHGATFDVRSGEATSLPAKRPIKTFDTQINADGWVEVLLPEIPG